MNTNDQVSTVETGGAEQAETLQQADNKTMGEAWVQAISSSAISQRMWTLSRIDATLGSIA